MEGRGKKSKQNDTAGLSASWILFSRMRQCEFMIISIHQKDEVAMTTTFILGQSQQYKKKVAITLNHKSATQNR